MEPLIYWCISSVLVVSAIGMITIGLLRAGGQHQFKNRRTAELEWQRRNPNTDWWLDIE